MTRTKKPMGVKRLSKPDTLEGGWMDLDSSSKETFEVKETKSGDYRKKNLSGDEPAYYEERYIEYTENEWYSFLIDTTASSLFANMKFVGDEKAVKEVETFFEDTCPDAMEEIYTAGLETVRDGTGFVLKIKSEDGKLKQLKHYPTWNLSLEFKASRDDEEVTDKLSAYDDEDYSGTEAHRWIKVTDEESDHVYWFREYPRMTEEDYSNEELAMFRLRKSHITPYGYPIGKACFHSIKALKGVNRDVLAAIKKAVANVVVIKYDTSMFSSDTEKEAKLVEMSSEMEGFEPATNEVVVIDKQHDIGYIGFLEGHSGGNEERLINIMGHLEPILSAVLLNYMVALGIVEQTGANKSLIARQMAERDREVKRLHTVIASLMKTQILPEITDGDVDVIFETAIDPEVLIQMYQIGMVSREWSADHLGILDNGETFAPEQQAENDMALAKVSKGNNSDGPKGRRGESQSRASRSRVK